MEIKVLKAEKNHVDLEVDNITIVEILRIYLNQDSSVEFAAWKQEHFTKNPVLTVKTKGKDAKKAVKDAVGKISKDLDSLEKDFKALK